MILIVDDKAENIFSLKHTLTSNGFSVDSAQSGEEALKKILKQSYALIILDVQMPGMDGFEVAETISGYSKARDIPIIFLSAVSVDKKFITQGYRSGAIDYVTKPVDPDIFILKVKTLYKLHEQKRELNSIRLALLEEVEIRKQAEEQLNKSLDEMRSIMEALPQVAFTMKPDGAIEYANEHWYLFSDDISKMPAFHPEDGDVADQIQGAIRTGQTYTGEVTMKNKLTGEWRFQLLKLIPVRQGLSIVKWVGTFTDIQEQKIANDILERKVTERTAQLSIKNKELEDSNFELQQFASVASHDLKEPLRKIQVFSSIIKERLRDQPPHMIDHVNRIIEASQRMSGLINDLLDYSRLSMASLFRDTDVRQLIAGILNDLEFSIRLQNALVTVGDLPHIEAIPGQIRQVFQNLISNSLKFVKPGKQPLINISGDVIVRDGCEYCRIEVTDNGIGFDEKYLEKIFTIFQRLNSADRYEGSGIGLAIVRKIIEKHNGTITAKSQEGEGATFIIELPVKQCISKGNTITETQRIQ